jgi:hypothetical protein
MSWLLDTNVLLRLADTQSPEHAVAEAAIEHLIAGEESTSSRCSTKLRRSWIAGSSWSTAFRSPASIPTMPAWQLCFSCMEFGGY